jgi:hypothetical protein
MGDRLRGRARARTSEEHNLESTTITLKRSCATALPSCAGCASDGHAPNILCDVCCGVQELQSAQHTLSEFLAHSAIFVSMSDIWYRKLYKHHVAGAAAADVGALRAVDDVLGQIMVKAFPQVVESIVAACARATFAALLNTLLNGGEYRFFTIDDADLLQADLTAFKVRAPGAAARTTCLMCEIANKPDQQAAARSRPSLAAQPSRLARVPACSMRRGLHLPGGI